MPNISADGAAGESGGKGFSFGTPAGKGINGRHANCNFWDDDCAQVGGTGGPGVQGGEGGPGGPGAHGGTLDIEVDSFSTLIKLSAVGGEGGRGGKGGKGQDGGKGGNGGNGQDCELGRHGGNGGSGGSAGVGGPGGAGGNGGTIVVRTRNIADGGVATINVSAGRGGRGGDPGAPGLPGSRPETMAQHPAFSVQAVIVETWVPCPIRGRTGTTPDPSSLGNGPSGAAGVSQFLQIV